MKLLRVGYLMRIGVLGRHLSILEIIPYQKMTLYPIHDADNDKQLKEAILKQIAMSHVIVIPTGMYANYSKWIQKEIDGSSDYNKPILAVNPWG